MDPPEPERLTLFQRIATRRMLRLARKRPDQPLSPEDWEAYLRMREGVGRVSGWVLRSLPASPRCGICGAPFAGFGGRLVRPLGFRPSRKNPHLCATCVELAPPGGMTMEAGVMFADLRGFTRLSEQASPEQIGTLLSRFYACAERALFPDAVIDKLIGDAVMALYLPVHSRLDDPATAMFEGARSLLSQVGYGSEEGPFVEVGIGLDFGEAYVGNVGQRNLFDFTAVGDVVNVAARLQGEAKGGEILVSERVAERLPQRPGERVEVKLKGKELPVVAYRFRDSLNPGLSVARKKPNQGTKEREMTVNANKALWEKGDFTRIAATMRGSGERLVAGLGIAEGMKVLDLGCGDGTTAAPAAQLGADVLGIDIASNLVAAGTDRAEQLGLTNLRFQEGDASDLSELGDESFDLVVSIFGAMFAPKPFDVATEMVRVAKPGGRIVMGNWIPGDPTLVAQILKISAAYAPPPPEGFVSPVTWGIEDHVTERFVAAGATADQISFERATWTFDRPGPPSELLADFRDYYGPTMNAFEAATANGRADELQAELDELFTAQNTSADATSIPATFLLVTVSR